MQINRRTRLVIVAVCALLAVTFSAAAALPALGRSVFWVTAQVTPTSSGGGMNVSFVAQGSESWITFLVYERITSGLQTLHYDEVSTLEEAGFYQHDKSIDCSQISSGQNPVSIGYSMEVWGSGDTGSDYAYDSGSTLCSW